MLNIGVELSESGLPLLAKHYIPVNYLKINMHRPRILIVDDEPGLVRILELMLRRTNRYEVFSVLDATQALQTVVRNKPHLVILDWVMPKISGGDVAQQIRADSRVRDTPILFLSAIISKRDKLVELGGIPAIAKPIGFTELIDAIEEQLRHASQTEI
jgi:DNA-binding response OmpR family regulator